jgi:hypothetical protein
MTTTLSLMLRHPGNRFHPPVRQWTAKYDELMDLVRQAGGQPIAVTDLSLINGRNDQQRSASVQGAARTRGVRIKTSNQNGYLYCWLVGPR